MRNRRGAELVRRALAPGGEPERHAGPASPVALVTTVRLLAGDEMTETLPEVPQTGRVNARRATRGTAIHFETLFPESYESSAIVPPQRSTTIGLQQCWRRKPCEIAGRGERRRSYSGTCGRSIASRDACATRPRSAGNPTCTLRCSPRSKGGGWHVSLRDVPAAARGYLPGWVTLKSPCSDCGSNGFRLQPEA